MKKYLKVSAVFLFICLYIYMVKEVLPILEPWSEIIEWTTYKDEKFSRGLLAIVSIPVLFFIALLVAIILAPKKILVPKRTASTISIYAAFVIPAVVLLIFD